MAKYHINNNGDALICKATQKCRFGGESGVENHFTNKNEAEKAAQQILAKKYGSLQPLKKKKAIEDLNKLSSKGVSIKKIDSIIDYNFDKINPNESSIDVLEEKPSEDFLNNIRKGILNYSKI